MNNLIIMPGSMGASLSELSGLNLHGVTPTTIATPPKANLPCDQENETSRKKFLQMYPDVAHKGVDPWVYYTTNGAKEKKTWPGPECPTLRWSSYPKCTMPFNQTRPGMTKDAMGRWTGIDPAYGNRTCRYMYQETLVNSLPWDKAPHCPASNVDRIWIGVDKKSWGHVADNDYDCEYAPNVLITASNTCKPCAATPAKPVVVPPKPIPVPAKPAGVPSKPVAIPAKPAVLQINPGGVSTKPPVLPATKPTSPPSTIPLCSKPFSMSDPTMVKIGNHFASTNDAGKGCIFLQANGLKWDVAPECPKTTTKKWTANGYKWGSATDKLGNYDCQDITKPLQCSQMASALGKKTMYNGKEFFSGKEKDGRDCLFLSHFKTATNNAATFATAPQCDQKAIGFEEDAGGHFWGWEDATKRKCVFRGAVK
jgi:hypothetical protein